VAKEPSQPETKASKAKKADVKPTQHKKTKKVVIPKPLLTITAPLRAAGRYVRGSWQELRQVFWPSRRASLGLTLAVILFTLFFTVVIVALDTAFQELFKRILL